MVLARISKIRLSTCLFAASLVAGLPALGSTASAQSPVEAATQATVTTLSASPNPAPDGSQVTLTAKVSSANATGSVKFSYNGAVPGMSPISGGAASLQASSAGIAPGSYAIVASYSGDATYAASSSAALPVVVKAAAPILTSATATTADSGATFLLAASGSNLSAGDQLVVNGISQVTAFHGQTLSATVAASSAGISANSPTATVQVVQSSLASNILLTELWRPASATAAARLLEQASFGPTAAEIAHVQQVGLQAWLYEQMQLPPTQYALTVPSDSTCTTVATCFQDVYVNNIVTQPDQLRQRLSLAADDMWVISKDFVDPAAFPEYENAVQRDVSTNWRTLMQDVTLSPAMGEMLNMMDSAKPANGQIANENFAREMMQLFSIGLEKLNDDGTVQVNGNGIPLPTFTESQVQAFARAYTGWTVVNPDGTTPTRLIGPGQGGASLQMPMVAVDGQHDTTQKAVLNETVLPAGQTAAQDLAGALDNLFADPDLPPFVCKQLIQHLVTSNPSGPISSASSTSLRMTAPACAET